MGGTSGRSRRALVACALFAVAAAGAAQSAAAGDVHALRDEAQAVADEITSLELRLSELEDERSELEVQITQSDQELAAMEVEIHDAEAAYAEASADFEERAIETYKAGAGIELEMLLSAKTLGDMYDVTRTLQEAATIDQDLIAELLDAKADAEAAQDRVDDQKQRLMEAKVRSDTLTERIGSTISARDSVFEELNDRIAELERQAEVEEKTEDKVDTSSLPYPGRVPTPRWGTHDPDRLVGTGPADGIPSIFRSTGVSFQGEASWYGPGFEGNTTANGDVFDSSLYTVASKTLPFGTYLYVKYGGRGVVVYVNDRGPYADDRILDLSHAAAQAIGISGVGWVRAEIIVKK
ncbi:MAG: septal ring lytic transglycosylase RlpA family protein [Actinomycetota bacterium]|nr:septal ring lytic transglycosylase RlpA family protein [Actinomycetota bacterium]